MRLYPIIGLFIFLTADYYRKTMRAASADSDSEDALCVDTGAQILSIEYTTLCLFEEAAGGAQRQLWGAKSDVWGHPLRPRSVYVGYRRVVGMQASYIHGHQSGLAQCYQFVCVVDSPPYQTTPVSSHKYITSQITVTFHNVLLIISIIIQFVPLKKYIPSLISFIFHF